MSQPADVQAMINELRIAVQELRNATSDEAALVDSKIIIAKVDSITTNDMDELDQLTEISRTGRGVLDDIIAKLMSQERHCARCHDTFTVQDNGPTSCTVPHMPCPRHYFLDERGVHRTSQCCLKMGGGNLNRISRPDLGNCFVGYHTDFFPQSMYNMVNIVPCKRDVSGICYRRPFAPGDLICAHSD